VSIDNTTFDMHPLLLPLDVKFFTVIKRKTLKMLVHQNFVSTFYKTHRTFSLYLINKSTVDHNEYFVSKERLYFSCLSCKQGDLWSVMLDLCLYTKFFFGFSLYLIENTTCLYYKDWSQQDIVTNISKSSCALSGGLSDFNQNHKVLENCIKSPWYEMLCNSIQ
jgi:hypothetical protein